MVNKIELFESTNTKTVRMVIKKEKLLIVNLILILSLNDKFDRKKWQICYSSQQMLENPTANLNILGYSCAKIRFKRLYLSNQSELVTCKYELSFLTTTNTVTSHSIELHPRSPCIYVICIEKYSIKVPVLHQSSLSMFSLLHQITVHTI